MRKGTIVELEQENWEREIKEADADIPYIIYPEREKRTITLLVTAKELPLSISDREALAMAKIIRDQIQSWS